LKVIGHGVDVVAAMFLEEPGDPLPAATTADYAQLDLSLIARIVCLGDGCLLCHHCGSRRSGTRDELTAPKPL